MNDSNCAPQKPMPPQGPVAPLEQELIERTLAELSALAAYGSHTMPMWNNIQRLAIEGEKYIREQHLNDDFTE